MKLNKIVLVVLAIALAGLAGFFAGRTRGTTPPDADEKPAAGEGVGAKENKATAPVQTKDLAESEITEQLSACGTVVAAAGARRTVTAPLEVKVTGVRVSGLGQRVNPGDPVVDVEPSPDTQLALQQARSGAEATARALKNIQDRYAMKLVASQDLQLAETAARDAEMKLKNLLDRGAAETQTLHAGGTGVVTRIDVVAGQVVAAGAAIMEIADPAGFDVCLGMDPRAAGRLVEGQKLLLQAAYGGQPVLATLKVIAGQLNPETRLIDILASLPPGQGWALGTAITATIPLSTKRALVVPRTAALEDDGSYALYTISSNRAVRHVVQLGIQNNRAVEIISATPPVSVGEPVVVSGNYELEDGMKVQVIPAP